jgi:hypothetical protein
MISLTLLYKMPPKYCQLYAPYPKASGNAFQALVDPLKDRNHLSFDGGDESTNGSHDDTIVIMNLYDSTTIYIRVADISNINMEMHYRNEKRLYKIEERVIGLCTNQYWLFDDVNSKIDNMLQKMDIA